MFRALFVYVLFSTTLSFGQVTYGTSAPTQQLPFERQLRKTVAFLQLDCRQGNEQFTVRGTGFFVEIPEKRLGEAKGFIYLVTNRHVAMCWNNDLQPMHILSTSVRLNRVDGLSDLSTMPGSPHWIFPADESVDLAVLPIAPSTETYDYMTVPYDMLVADEKLLSEGMQVILSGYFYQLPGEKRIEPIIREGVLAMIPDEEILTATRRRGKVYLCDVHTFHGNSGSPVFVDAGGLRTGLLGRKFQMLGVVSGGYNEDEDFNLTLEATLKGTLQGNSGIALIVPAAYLKSLLDDQRLVAIRDAEVARILAQKK
jgi:hypothetical protein